jgi:hypothetical protein
MSHPNTEEIPLEESLRYHLYPEPEPELDDVDANDTEGRATYDEMEVIEEEEKGQEEDMDTGMSRILQKIVCF